MRKDNIQVQLSIVSPVYKAEVLIPFLVAEIKKAVEPLEIDYEIILIEDGSPDCSWSAIQSAVADDNRVKGIKLSRNFGQHIAITAGLEHSSGDWIVVMDCDLQDEPRHIPALVAKANTGFQVVTVKRIERQDKKRKKISSIIFYGLFAYMTDRRQDSSIANYGIYHRDVINAVLAMGDYVKFFPAQIQWVGFRQTSLPLPHAARKSGSTSYNWRRLCSLAVNNILSFSDKPLKIATGFGFLVASLSFVLGVVYLLMGLFGIIAVSGFVSIIVSLFFTTGSIVLVVGIVGLYVGKTFESSKNRPLYIVESIF